MKAFRFLNDDGERKNKFHAIGQVNFRFKKRVACRVKRAERTSEMGTVRGSPFVQKTKWALKNSVWIGFVSMLVFHDGF